MRTVQTGVLRSSGVRPPKAASLTPRQRRYISGYLNSDSSTFGNSYQSALVAGYTDTTAKNLTHLNPDWLSENIGKIEPLDLDQLLLKLAAIANDPKEPTMVKLKAIDMLMRHHRMYEPPVTFQQHNALNIQSIID